MVNHTQCSTVTDRPPAVLDAPRLEWLGYHFLLSNGCLANNDGRRVVVGETLSVEPPLILCQRGLHASRQALDALGFAPGPIVCRVRLSGVILEETDKAVGSERTVLWMFDASETLRAFARWCALSVAHLWEMPEIVRRYLETGDESIRAAARAAARDAARDAARAAAWDAARAAAWDAARDAARDAAWDAARDAARAAAWDAAWDAARDAAWAAAWDAQNQKLESMLAEAHSAQQVAA